MVGGRDEEKTAFQKPARWFTGDTHLFLEPTAKEKTNSHKLTSDLYMSAPLNIHTVIVNTITFWKKIKTNSGRSGW